MNIYNTGKPQLLPGCFWPPSGICFSLGAPFRDVFGVCLGGVCFAGPPLPQTGPDLLVLPDDVHFREPSGNLLGNCNGIVRIM